MKKILFGITSLTLGGAERVLVDILNSLKDTYDITLLTLYPNGEFESELEKGIKIKSIYQKPYNQMNRFEKLSVSFKLLFQKYKMYKENIKEDYDTQIAFLEGPMTRLFTIGNVRKIAWVHSDIAKIFGNNFKAKLKKKLDENIYKHYEKIVFVSLDNLEKFKTTYPKVKKDKLQVIYNYIDKDKIIKKANEDIEELKNEDLNIGIIARLVEAKGLDRLIKVHKKLIEGGYSHYIYIIGDGPLKEELEKEISKNNVKDTFILLGQKENPYPYMKQMDVVSLVSYYEGLPVTLMEAKILNKYIFITDTAAREVLKDYPNSKIVENNEEGIYNGICDIIQNKEEILKKVKDDSRYDNTNILNEIKALIESK